MSALHREGCSHLFNRLHTCRLKLLEDERQPEKSIIAQPIFVFEKREQTFKRPAEETLCEAAEHECNSFSRKRIRSSSFTLHSTDSQSRGVSTLSQKRMRSSSFTDLPTFPPSGPEPALSCAVAYSSVSANTDIYCEEKQCFHDTNSCTKEC